MQQDMVQVSVKLPRALREQLRRRVAAHEAATVSSEVAGILTGARPPLGANEEFYAKPDIEVLARLQGVKPITDISELEGGWPEDEDIDEFVAAVRRWRDEG